MSALIGQDSTNSGFDPGLQDPKTTFGVWGDSGDDDGVIGSSKTGVGVFGRALDAAGAAVRGLSDQGIAVDAVSTHGTAVHARSGSDPDSPEATLASPSHSGDFRGPVRMSGALDVSGSGVFGGNVKTGAIESLAGSSGTVGVTGGLNVSGSGVFGGNVKTGAIESLAGFSGTVGVTGGLNVSGSGVFGGNVKTGAIESLAGFSGTVGVTGGLNVSGSGVFGGNVKTGAIESLAGSSGTVGVTGGLNVRGSGTFGGSIKVGKFTGDSAAAEGSLVINNERPAGGTSGTANAVCAVSKNGAGLWVSGGKNAIMATGVSFLGGNVQVKGVLKADDKRFVIDSPTDPERKTLTHTCVESDERCNVYSGNAVLDDDGTAEVELPSWFCALNTDFRYQLTCIGQSAPVYIAKEVAANAFSIAGGSAGLKVSWQLTGIRDDAWARANTLVIEEDKPAEDQGYFLNPEAFGHDITRSVYYRQYAALAERYPQRAETVIRNFQRATGTQENSASYI
ncbi:hypothetical protein [Nocardia gipuzkoensis]|uniref:hypothetical protein n=1 Tax=Nocardia gipuzkoensis TaxID=2749991 RepID=UPI003EE0B70F